MASIVAAWPTVALGTVVASVTRQEAVLPNKEYRLLGVRLDGNGPFLRETKLGAQLSATTLSQVAVGDFIYSRLFAWRGAFGTIGPELDGCYVSGEFPTFRPVPGMLDAEYLRLWFRLPSTLATVEADCSGSTPLTRNRFKEQFFLAMQVPLPPPDEQRRIVARIEELAARIEEARGLRREAMAEAEGLVQAARNSVIGELSPSWKPLRSEVQSIENGHSPACEPRPAEDDEWGVLKVGAVSFGAFNPNENKVLSPTYEPDIRYEVRPGDFLMCRANTRELVGACAIVDRTRPRLMLSDKTFRFVFNSRAGIKPEYLDQVLKSSALRRQIEQQATGTSPTMKNISKEKVLDLLIPPHSPEEQRRIVEYLTSVRGLIDATAQLQARTAAELEALLPSVLDMAFRGEL